VPSEQDGAAPSSLNDSGYAALLCAIAIVVAIVTTDRTPRSHELAPQVIARVIEHAISHINWR